MIYAYIRVSSDKQTVENQRFEINNFCRDENISIDRWFEETISGTKSVKERKLGSLMKRMKSGDIIICTEISRLGRSLLMIFSILNEFMSRDVQIWTIKDGLRLGENISSKVLAFAFGLSAEIERSLISQRTAEALARKKREGIVLGRPQGAKSSYTKLTGKEEKIAQLLAKGLYQTQIAKRCKVSVTTLRRYLKAIRASVENVA